MRMSNITVIGSLNTDLTMHTDRIPAMGETLHGHGFAVFPGGKGANQAVAAARLGAITHLVGCVGEDTFGRDLVGNLADNKVRTEYIRILPGQTTGVAVIVVKDHDNFILLDAGANAGMDKKMVCAAAPLIQQSDMVLLQLEIPMDAVEEAVWTADRHSIPILLNPAPYLSLPTSLLHHIDLLIPNKGECAAMTGMDLDSPQSIREALICLRDRGVRRPVVTLGGEGAAWLEQDQLSLCPAPVVDVVDTTAAGDAFCAALACSLTGGRTLGDAVSFATRAASISVTRKGAQPSLPHLNEVPLQ